ncbi:MAG: EamA family transporter [Bacteroidales bacterium]|nr:EamA family transporter [Bacteroidales bacterium]
MKLSVLILLQTAFLSTGNILFKVLMTNLPKFSWSKEYFRVFLKNWHWGISMGVSFSIAAILWMYILKHFEISKAYPLTALSYIFGMVLAALFLGEAISVKQWLGAGLIIVGCFLILS